MSVQSRGDMAEIIKHVANNQFWDTQNVSFTGSQISRWTQKTQLKMLSYFPFASLPYTQVIKIFSNSKVNHYCLCHALCHYRELSHKEKQ